MMNSTLTFTQIKTCDISELMLIENACHSHPWSDKTFASCIGERYFGEKLLTNIATEHQQPPQRNAHKTIGFYVGEMVIDEATLMDICVEPNAQGKGYGKHGSRDFSVTPVIGANDS